MTILCIENSTSVCSAAVCKNGEPIDRCICREGSNHARLLPRYIDHLLRITAEQGLTMDAVAVSEGPGSYTGLRIATSTAKGLCYGMHVPLIPVPTLQLLCAAAVSHMPTGIGSATLCPMIDARRMEVYTAMYDSALHELTETAPLVIEGIQSLPQTQGEVYYFGDGAAKCRTALQDPHWHMIPDIIPEAQYMGLLAEQKIRDGYAGADIAYYEPFYLKQFIAAQSHVKGLK